MMYKALEAYGGSQPHNSGGILSRKTLEVAIKDTRNYVGHLVDYVIFKRTGCGSSLLDWKLVYDSRGELKNCTAFEEYDQTKQSKEYEMMNKTLYTFLVDGKESFGHKLAVNSAGQWVMEVKGSGTVVAVDARNIEEVLPYTVDVRFKEGGSKYSYFNEARDLKVDDFFINSTVYEPSGGNYQIGRVIAVDTKSKHAKTELNYFKKL